MSDVTTKPHQGKIVVFSGPMFAGKTTHLIEIAEQLTRVKKDYVAYKPLIDKRYSATEISSHKQSRLICTLVESITEIAPSSPNILIDEAQFFEKEAAQHVRSLANAGSNVYVAGLNMDSFGKPFGPMPELMAIADTVVPLQTICGICGNYEAKFTYRKSASQEQTSVGGSESYDVRCRSCWSS